MCHGHFLKSSQLLPKEGVRLRQSFLTKYIEPAWIMVHYSYIIVIGISPSYMVGSPSSSYQSSRLELGAEKNKKTLIQHHNLYTV